MELYYVDVPRFSAFARNFNSGISAYSDHLNGLDALQLPLTSFLLHFKRQVEHLQPFVSDIPDLSAPDNRLLGVTFSFDDIFRTKNVPYPTRTQPKPKFSGGPWAKTPHIYRKFGDWKLAMRIDPKWITAPGAYCKLRPTGGHKRFTGLCTVSSLHLESKRISAVPLFIGRHVSPLNDLFITRQIFPQ